MMYKCAECAKECYFHRYYQNDDTGKVKAIPSNTPTYYMTVENSFIPFCSCKCSNDYYTKNIKDNNALVLKNGKYETATISGD